ncbi:sec-independent protein translocase protein TatC [Pustulibacterium marinum]|uniref:Sec-independent protein translocase protein TatC n=1 Tax=Pustulibacterium marinum TaxID=1224947 RepID=A0A1I7HNC2_9FLAO|nr:twin-arginine translocase subunit TatC [Pustulibacterium marinum]SFU62240.1 sec-independent protein translocase protein TatC [Pustulibacterium marinum]
MAKKIKKNPEEMSFLDHLEELRWHLIRSCLAVVIVGSVAFAFKRFIFDVIIFGPKDPNFPTYRFFCFLSQKLGLDETFCTTDMGFIIQNTGMAGQFSAHIWTSIWAGVIIGFPYLVYELWKFISPGLYENERKNARGFIFITSFLFFLGVTFGYFIITPLSINFLGNYSVSSEVKNQIVIDSYVAILRSSVLASGVIFELPIIIYFFTKIGLITPKFMRTYRKHAIVVVLILSAVITPPDIASQIVVSIPIIILYEISIFISAYVLKRDKKKMKQV